MKLEKFPYSGNQSSLLQQKNNFTDTFLFLEKILTNKKTYKTTYKSIPGKKGGIFGKERSNANEEAKKEKKKDFDDEREIER